MGQLLPDEPTTAKLNPDGTATAHTVSLPGQPAITPVAATTPSTPDTTVVIPVQVTTQPVGNSVQQFMNNPVVIRFFKGAFAAAASALVLYAIRVLPSLNLFQGYELSVITGILLAAEKALQLPQ